MVEFEKKYDIDSACVELYVGVMPHASSDIFHHWQI